MSKFSSALRTANRLVNQTAENSIASQVAAGTFDHGNVLRSAFSRKSPRHPTFVNLALSERPFDDLPEHARGRVQS